MHVWRVNGPNHHICTLFGVVPGDGIRHILLVRYQYDTAKAKLELLRSSLSLKHKIHDLPNPPLESRQQPKKSNVKKERLRIQQKRVTTLTIQGRQQRVLAGRVED